MTTVKIDIARSAGVYDQFGWKSLQTEFVIAGLSRTVGAHDDLLTKAATALFGSYAYGSAHPDAAGLYLLGEVAFRAAGEKNTRAVRATATYQRPTGENSISVNDVTIRGGATLVSEATNVDRDGDPLEVSWKRTAASAAITQRGTVHVWTPCRTLEFGRAARSGHNPHVDARIYINTRNVAAWQGDDAKEWLLQAWEFSSPNSGASWMETIRFVHNPNGWVETLYYLLDNGRPPENIGEAYNEAAILEFEPAGVADFSALGLPTIEEGT